VRLPVTIFIAAAGGLALSLALLGDDPEPGSRNFRRQQGDGLEPTIVKPPSKSPLELSGAQGTNVYTPRSDTVLLDDGSEVSYPALLVWCGRFDAVTDETFRVQDVRILLNEKPRSKSDLEAHVTVPLQIPAERIGDVLLEAMGKRASGITARKATFKGGRDLETSREVALEDGVVIHLHDAGDPDRNGQIRCQSMMVELNEGRLVRGYTDGEVRISTSAGTLQAHGMSFVAATGVVRIEREIVGELRDLSLIQRDGAPVKVRARGPLVYTPKDQDAVQPALKPVGTFLLQNDIVVEHDQYRFQGQNMTLVTREGRSGIASFVLEDGVSVAIPKGTFTGSRATFTQGDPGSARLVVQGPPVKATISGGSLMLPGMGGTGDLAVSTDGDLVVEGMDLPEGEAREILLGPSVSITSTDGTRVSAESMTVALRHLPSNRATDKEGHKTLTPERVKLEGLVRGDGPRGSLRCQVFLYERKFHPSGRVTRDVVTMTRGALLKYVPSVEPGEATSGSARAISRHSLLAGDGALEIRAEDELRLELDPMRTGPIKTSGRGTVRVCRFDRKDRSKERGVLIAEEVDLVLSEEFAPDLDSVEVRIRSMRRVRRAAARRDVHVTVPGSLKGEGDVLTWDGDSGELLLMRLVGEPATATLTDSKGREQRINATRLRYMSRARTVQGSGGVSAVIEAPPFSYGSGSSSETVSTEVAAESVTAWLQGDGGGASEVIARGEVVARQGKSAGVTATELRLDLVQDNAVLEGAPARIAVTRAEGTQALDEWVQAPTIVVTNGEALLTGPVSARLHAPRRMALNIAATDKSKDDAPAGLLPVQLEARKDLLLTRDRIQARGPASVRQGDPGNGGFSLRGERIVLFLVDESGEEQVSARDRRFLRSLDVARAVVEGETEFQSQEIHAKGDVIEFDREDKAIILYRLTGNASLKWQGTDQIPRPRFDLNLKDPDNPRLISTLSPPKRNRQ